MMDSDNVGWKSEKYKTFPTREEHSESDAGGAQQKSSQHTTTDVAVAIDWPLDVRTWVLGMRYDFITRIEGLRTEAVTLGHTNLL